MAPSVWSDSLANHKQRLREHIIHTAADLVAELGTADVPMSLLARRAGIARATLYNYFPDFERVLTALVADQVARFRTHLDQQLATVSDPPERLRRYLLAVHRWSARQRQQRPATNHRDTTGKLSPHVIAAMHEPLTELRDVLTGILAAGVADRSFATDIDPSRHAGFILKLLLDPGSATGSPAQLLRFIERGLTLGDTGLI
jgi:AcrR family transcriptional regulator